MFSSFFKKSNHQQSDQYQETFTYYIPKPTNRSTGYREKELDSITRLFTLHGIAYKIASTIPSDSGFWVILNIESSLENYQSLLEDEKYTEFLLNRSQPELDIIHESDEQFTTSENYKL